MYSSESEISALGLYVTVKNISPTGAVMIFNRHTLDGQGEELIFGDEFLLQRQTDSGWENLPTVIDSYGFNSIAHLIPSDGSVEMEVDWEWLYGELSPGEYRIGKRVLDSADGGKSEEYMVYAQFVLN